MPLRQTGLDTDIRRHAGEFKPQPLRSSSSVKGFVPNSVLKIEKNDAGNLAFGGVLSSARVTTKDARLMSMKMESRAKGWRSKIWVFLNSAFGLRLLSSVALGGGTWSFQQWRDSVQKADAAQQRFERLQFEVAGRTSEYLSWFAANCARKPSKDKDYEFRDGVNAAIIIQSIKEFGDLPRRQLTAIKEMLPDFKDRSLISIFAELKLLNDKEKVAHGINGRSYHEADNFTEENFAKLPVLERRGSTYIRAMRYLVTDVNEIPKSITYDEFRKRFSTVFLYPEMQDFDFPYTDCFDC